MLSINESREVFAMSRLLVNHLPELLKKKGWNTNTFIAYCMLAGIGQDTAYRLARGETNFTTQTLAKIVNVLGVSSICDIVDVEEQG